MTGTPLSDIVVADFTHARAGPWCDGTAGRTRRRSREDRAPRRGRSEPRRPPEAVRDGVRVHLPAQEQEERRVDLKEEDGRQVAEDFIAEADVLVENFAPGVMDRLGLGYDYLAEEVNPGLVYASIKGTGRRGRSSTRKAWTS